MSFVSYAQNFEDVMLWRALKHIKNGFYIDVGAHDPVLGSVTKAFYDQGWNGINIEPTTAPFNLLNTSRLRDINLQICAGPEIGTIDLYDISPSGLASVVPSIAEKYRDKEGYTVRVERTQVSTLESICNEHVSGEIHFLKIDVEGCEKDVLLGANFSIFRPWIVVLEATLPNSAEINSSEWEHIILNAGYKLAYFDGLNKFYVSVEHKELLRHFTVPPNYFDGFLLSSSCFFSRGVLAELEQAKAAQAEANKAEARAAQVEANKAKQAEAKVKQAETKVKQAEIKTEQAETRAEQLNTELHLVYISRSWWITTPLRWGLHQLRLIRQQGISSRLKALLKKIVRSVVKQIITFVNSSPNLRSRLISISKKIGFYDNFKQLYRRFSSPHTQQSISLNNTYSNVHFADSAIHINHLTPQARRIYVDLKANMATQDKEDV